MKSLGLTLMVAGALIFASGVLLWLAARFNLPLGRLPGDFHWQSKDWSQGRGWAVYFPFMTMLILSLLLTLLLNLFFRK